MKKLNLIRVLGLGIFGIVMLEFIVSAVRRYPQYYLKSNNKNYKRLS